MKIKNNFLDEQLFNKLVNLIDPFSEEEKLSFVPSFKVTKDGSAIGNIQFVHSILPSKPFSLLDKLGISEELSVETWVKAKINFSLGQEAITPSYWHIDVNSPEKSMKTGILYLNTNNGYTEFKDGTRIESVANRYVEFNTGLMHRGINCTDNSWRAVLNINFIPRKTF